MINYLLYRPLNSLNSVFHRKSHLLISNKLFEIPSSTYVSLHFKTAHRSGTFQIGAITNSNVINVFFVFI